MGLIHTRASKKRDKAAAKLLEAQRKELRHDRRAGNREVRAEVRESRAKVRESRAQIAGQAPVPGRSWFRQPTVGQALKAWRNGGGRQE